MPQAMTTQAIDQARAEEFTTIVMGILNSGSLALMMSIGHRTGLFDTMATLPASNSHEIALAAGLQERYVREWLGAMVTGKIILYDPITSTYTFPPEHAASLTRAASPNNLAVPMQHIALLGAVEDGIVSCFRHGGGVPYAAYPRFQEVMAEDSAQTVVGALLDAILPLVAGLREALQEGINVLEIGCGRGRALNVLAQAFPRSRFTGYDISTEGIAAGQAEAAYCGLGNLHFAVHDVARLTDIEQYDLVLAFDAIHDQARPAQVLRGIATALRPTGTFLMQDIHASSDLHNNLEHPLGPALYTISCMHCMTVSLAQSGEGLGTVWGEERAIDMLREAGFASIDVQRLPHDFINNYYIAKKF